MTRPKHGPIWSNISGSTGPIFAIFTPYERALRADDGSTTTDTTCIRALVLENELQYHGLAVRSISAYDARISCKNFVKFGPVTPELTGLICEHQV